MTSSTTINPNSHALDLTQRIGPAPTPPAEDTRPTLLEILDQSGIEAAIIAASNEPGSAVDFSATEGVFASVRCDGDNSPPNKVRFDFDPELITVGGSSSEVGGGTLTLDMTDNLVRSALYVGGIDAAAGAAAVPRPAGRLTRMRVGAEVVTAAQRLWVQYSNI